MARELRGDIQGLRAVAVLVVIATHALDTGALPPSQDNRPGEIAPSATRLAAYLRCSKPQATQVRAMINEQGARAS